MERDNEVHRVAEAQHGLVTIRQAGLTRAAVRHRRTSEAWTQIGRSVLRRSGSPDTPEQRLMAAVLDAGPRAVASHEAAAWLWTLPGFPPGPLDVTRPRSKARTRPTIGEVHESRRLPAHHRTVLRDIPVMTVGRTLFDLAGAPGMSAHRVERAVDNALARSPMFLPRLHAMLKELAAKGRPGIALMRELLAERPKDYIAPASGLEARAKEILDEAGIATVRQVDLGGADWIGRLDLRVVGTNVVIEIDSVLHHTSLSDRRRDALRDAELAAAGLVVVRVTEHDVFQRPWILPERVRSGLRNGRPGDHFATQKAG